MNTDLKLLGPKWLAFLGDLFWIAGHSYYIFSGIDYRAIAASILLAALGVLFMAAAIYRLIRGPHLGPAGKAGAGALLTGMVPWIVGAALAGMSVG